MEWTPDNSNQDIEDRRADSGSGGGGFGGSGFGMPHLGIGGLLIVGVLSLVFHQNFFALLSGGGASNAGYQTQRPASRSSAAQTPGQNDREYQFIAFVLHDVQNFWTKALPAQANIPYRHAHTCDVS